jgi:hypothetical protein
VRDFIGPGALQTWPFDDLALGRAFERMERYSNPPMDPADASLIAAVEVLGTRRIFTIERRDFSSHRVRRGHHHHAVDHVF